MEQDSPSAAAMLATKRVGGTPQTRELGPPSHAALAASSMAALNRASPPLVVRGLTVTAASVQVCAATLSASQSLELSMSIGVISAGLMDELWRCRCTGLKCNSCMCKGSDC